MSDEEAIVAVDPEDTGLFDAVVDPEDTGLFDAVVDPEDTGLFDARLEQNYEDVKSRIKCFPDAAWQETASPDPSLLLQTRSAGAAAAVDPVKLVREKLQMAWQRVNKPDTRNLELTAAWQRVNKPDTRNLELTAPSQKVNKPDTPSLELTAEQRMLLLPMLAHQDVYSLAASPEADPARRLYCLHILNETLKLRSRITRNNERLAEDAECECKDQGFTRPRTLILVPFRSVALDVVKVLTRLWTSMDGQVDNQKRLREEFGPSEEDLERLSRPNVDPDFAQTFRGNIDDCFRIGIKCTRKAMKLFCDFYASDIIIASPMGLRFVLDGQSEVRRVGNKKKRVRRKGDYDFLSSIQLTVIEHADVIAMQNWEHLLHVLQHLNRLPTKDHGCDFSRVQNIFLDGLGASTRQNVIFSQYAFPELNALIKGLTNCAGQQRIARREYAGVLKGIAARAKPQLHLIQADTPEQLPKVRFNYFVNSILEALPQDASHICVFVPSYLDFVQLREYMVAHDTSHTILSEYCTGPEISRARSAFFQGQKRILLVTERFHFFKRYRIRGIRQLIFFGLPEHAEYYAQWCGMLEGACEGVCKKTCKGACKGTCKGACEVPIIVSPYDRLKAERILGTKRVERLC